MGLTPNVSLLNKICSFLRPAIDVLDWQQKGKKWEILSLRNKINKKIYWRGTDSFQLLSALPVDFFYFKKTIFFNKQFCIISGPQWTIVKKEKASTDDCPPLSGYKIGLLWNFAKFGSLFLIFVTWWFFALESQI